MKLYIKPCLGLITLLFLNCCRYYCGDDWYPCSDITFLESTRHPIRYDDFTHSVLFENGELIYIDYKSADNIWQTYDMAAICNSHAFKDIIYYDDYLLRRNYDQRSGPGITYPPRIFILSPTKCCIWDGGSQILGEFGNNGQGEEILAFALDADIDTDGTIFILDTDDSKVKKYTIDGVFSESWEVPGYCIRLKLYNDIVYVLDLLESRILKYNKAGDFLGPAIANSNFQNMIAFALVDSSIFWVADMYGSRLTNVTSSGEILGEKTDYCFYDAEFEFEEIFDIYGNPYFLRTLDYSSKSLTYFRVAKYFCP